MIKYELVPKDLEIFMERCIDLIRLEQDNKYVMYERIFNILFEVKYIGKHWEGSALNYEFIITDDNQYNLKSIVKPNSHYRDTWFLRRKI